MLASLLPRTQNPPWKYINTGTGVTQRLVSLDFFDGVTSDVPPQCAGASTGPSAAATIASASATPSAISDFSRFVDRRSQSAS